MPSRKRKVEYGPTEPQYLYDLWKRIRGVTGNKNHPKYKDYGGRGIGMYEPWRPDFPKFRSWMLKNLGERPTPGHSLDRKNVNKGYTPGNIQWATLVQQARNQRSNRMVTIGRKTKCLMEWCELYDRDVKLAWMRIFQLGWDPLKALTTPPRKLTFKNKKQRAAFILVYAAEMLTSTGDKQYTLAKALKLLDHETAEELVDYISVAGYNRCKISFTQFDGADNEDRADMASWLRLKIRREGPADPDVVSSLRQEDSASINRPVILDTIGDIMVEGRHRMTLAIQDRLRIPVVCIH